ncbi:MAG: dTDP-4-amino-4,6-dideoxy-D-galactose acyltransferase [Gaiellaceae bacterium]|nr:dTDP-4-amino-4,6-dideoxy-D-galactose acyltransferase [Gaiellaceae bacterium]
MTTTDSVACELLEWDTAFWGFPVARVTGVLTAEEARAADRWCIENGARVLFALVEAADKESRQVAETSGFAEVDSRITLRQAAGERRRTRDPRIREARDSDREALARIARTAHATTRFYHDPHFDPDRCGELYARWILSACDGAEAILVADDGGCVGYLSLDLDPERGVGRLALLAVESSRQREGLGRALVEAGIELLESRGAHELEVVTQERNAAALHVFERAGFIRDRAELWFHKWYD